VANTKSNFSKKERLLQMSSLPFLFLHFALKKPTNPDDFFSLGSWLSFFNLKNYIAADVVF
jgi:hypothetical protein